MNRWCFLTQTITRNWFYLSVVCGIGLRLSPKSFKHRCAFQTLKKFKTEMINGWTNITPLGAPSLQHIQCLSQRHQRSFWHWSRIQSCWCPSTNSTRASCARTAGGAPEQQGERQRAELMPGIRVKNTNTQLRKTSSTMIEALPATERKESGQSLGESLGHVKKTCLEYIWRVSRY